MTARLFCSLILPLVLVNAGCDARYMYNPTGASAPSREATCGVELIHSVPQRPYKELGVFQAGLLGPALSSAAFVEAVRSQACAAGADAVIAKLTDIGEYVQGVAIKFDP